MPASRFRSTPVGLGQLVPFGIHIGDFIVGALDLFRVEETGAYAFDGYAAPRFFGFYRMRAGPRVYAPFWLEHESNWQTIRDEPRAPRSGLHPGTRLLLPTAPDPSAEIVLPHRKGRENHQGLVPTRGWKTKTTV